MLKKKKHPAKAAVAALPSDAEKFFVIFNYDGSKDFSVYVAANQEEAASFINCQSMQFSSVLGTFQGKFFRDVCDLEDNRDSDEPVNCRTHDITHAHVGDRR